MQTYLKLAILFVFGILPISAGAQDISTVKGIVYSVQDNLPLPGANIRVKGSNLGAVTDKNGLFELLLDTRDTLLEVSFIGFEKIEYPVKLPITSDLKIFLSPLQVALEEVEVVSTGYEKLPKERATGSFAFLNQELVDRRVSTNTLDRLQDITPGLIFNRSASSNDPISIRGRGTIFANTMPLIVVDNFPYDGTIENINPNDVESITVLKDAAAASIWGARAGNGVIVITTKRGQNNSPIQVSFNSNFIFTEKPDLYYSPRMTNSELIEVEQMLFDRGFYNSAERANTKTALSPTVEILIAERDGEITQEEARNLMGDLKTRDVRQELEKYYYRPMVSQQYSFAVRGGSQNNSYNVSLGYDRVDASVVDNSRNRYTLNAQNQWNTANDRLSFGLGLYVVGSRNNELTEIPSLYSYDRLADENRNPLPVTRSYSRRFVESKEVAGLLDWNFYPLNEIGQMGNRSKATDLRLTGSLNYRIAPAWTVSISHQYWSNNTVAKNLQSQNSFFVRDLVNQFSVYGSDSVLIRNIPMGGILDYNGVTSSSHNFRAQINYSKEFSPNTSLDILGGFESKDLKSDADRTRYYGYSDEIAINVPVDYKNLYPLFYSGRMTSIPFGDGHVGTIDRFLSAYVNGSFNWRNKYSITGSARRDASNLFGVNSNQRAVPLWSLGALWIVSEESFLSGAGFPFVKLRATYGFNGNIDSSVSAYTTGRFFSGGPLAMISSLPYADIVNPPNPNLRWERIGIFNLGLDLETVDSKWNLSLDFYSKNGKDLIGDSPTSASTGVQYVRGNFANTRTLGLDLELQTKIIDRNLKWSTRFLFSHVREEVTGYARELTVYDYLDGTVRTVPLEGKPLFGLFSIPFAGLDPLTGDPLGYIDGEASKDYSELFSGLSLDKLRYHGSSRPTFYGTLTNNFNWKNWNLSFNLTYRMGYYYRRETVNYSEVLAGRISHGDYTQRWLEPGDELATVVPSMPSTNNNNRNNLTRLGSHLVEKGDHIRWQDIRLSYLVQKSIWPMLPVNSVELYTYIDNIGIIWKASDDKLDPDFRSLSPMKSVAVGLKVNF